MACTSAEDSLVNRVERLAGALALLLRSLAHEIVLLLDRLHAFVAGVGDDAGDLARPRRRRVERFLEQAGEALQPLTEIFRARVECRNQRLDFGVPTGDRILGSAVADFEQFDGVGERAAVRAELIGKVAEVASAPWTVTVLNVPRCCSTLAVVAPLLLLRSLMAATNSETRVAMVCSIELMFS